MVHRGKNDPVFLDVGPARRRAHARSDHVLPIGTKRDMPDPDHVALARPLEGQDVVAASDPFHRIRVEFLLAAVEAGLDDEERPGYSGEVLRSPFFRCCKRARNLKNTRSSNLKLEKCVHHTQNKVEKCVRETHNLYLKKMREAGFEPTDPCGNRS